MPRIRYTYQTFTEIPRTGDARMFDFHFFRVPVNKIGQPDERSATKETAFRVRITASVFDGTWKVAEGDVPKVAYQIAQRALQNHGATPVEITSYNTPGSCPYDPNDIVFPPTEPFEVEQPIGFHP